MPETQVYRMLAPGFNDRCSEANKCFSTDKCYSTALYKKRTGRNPDEKYFTTNSLRYVGKYLRTETQGYSSTTEIFNNKGKEEKVELDYEGHTCFVETPCKSTLGGKRRMKKTRKQQKKRKGTRGRKH